MVFSCIGRYGAKKKITLPLPLCFFAPEEQRVIFQTCEVFRHHQKFLAALLAKGG